jgi:hypothetical protein
MYGMMEAVISPAISMTEDARNLIQEVVRKQIATNSKSAQVAMN